MSASIRICVVNRINNYDVIHRTKIKAPPPKPQLRWSRLWKFEHHITYHLPLRYCAFHGRVPVPYPKRSRTEPDTATNRVMCNPWLHQDRGRSIHCIHNETSYDLWYDYSGQQPVSFHFHRKCKTNSPNVSRSGLICPQTLVLTLDLQNRLTIHTLTSISPRFAPRHGIEGILRPLRTIWNICLL